MMRIVIKGIGLMSKERGSTAVTCQNEKANTYGGQFS